MFWGGLTLKDRLKELITYEDGKTPSVDIIDCSAITLSLGSEVYITPSKEDSAREKIKLTDEKPQFTIPKGQFAFLITEEFISVPIEAMAFISFKAKYKFKGLINVSGFHVDPGWKGRLVFSVFNAGPQDVVFERGDSFALIWYASLDFGTHSFSKTKEGLSSIESKLVDSMSGEVFSPFKLRKELEDLKEQILKSEYKVRNYFFGIISTLFFSILTFTFKDDIAKAIKCIFS